MEAKAKWNYTGIHITQFCCWRSSKQKRQGVVMDKMKYSYYDFKKAVINKYLDMMNLSSDEGIQEELKENEDVFLLDFRSLQEDLKDKDVVAKDTFNKRVLSTAYNLYMLI